MVPHVVPFFQVSSNPRIGREKGWEKEGPG